MTETASKQQQCARLQTLFVSFQAGQTQVVPELFLSLSRILNSYFRARLPQANDCDDLLQTSLLKIHLSRHAFDPKKNLKTWVFTIAHRTLIDHWRRLARTRDAFDDGLAVEELASEAALSDQLDLLSLRTLVADALDHLKPLDQSVVYLAVEEGLSMAEIAQVTESTKGAIKVRLHRALKTLRQSLRKGTLP